ncbi:MAG TPA: universal stress protein [Ilumatobacteraceae bacterium]|jgi:nucleotide-binding universal stress UspA family protein
MTQVLIAVDDTERSLHVARVAYDLFGDGAAYTVVNVTDQSPMIWGGDSLMWGVGYPVLMAPAGLLGVAPGDGDDGQPKDIDAASIEAAIQVAHDVAEEADLPNPQVVGESGDPAQAIITAARHHQADVIVVGSHDHSWLSDLFVPSVTGAVVKESEIPVLIAR